MDLAGVGMFADGYESAEHASELTCLGKCAETRYLVVSLEI
jgi:hypothetical protein